MDLHHAHTYSLATPGLARLASWWLRLGRREARSAQCDNSPTDALALGPSPCPTRASLLMVPNK